MKKIIVAVATAFLLNLAANAQEPVKPASPGFDVLSCKYRAWKY